MMKRRFRVLLIEDDEDDYVLVRDVLSESALSKFHLDWARTYEAGIDAACRAEHDIVLLDYRLGHRNGLELLREAQERGCELPFIVLTGQGDYILDIEAMEAGAADYLVKGEISSDALERTIRYCVDRKRTELELRRANEMLRAEIEERKRVVKALLESESLAAMGRALSSVAHDMKTPLIAIGGFTRLARNHMEKTDPYRQKLDIVIKETQRLEAMVKDMLDFSRPLDIDRSDQDVDEVIGESLVLLDSLAREHHVSLRGITDFDLAPASLDRMRMKQVLVNLAANAVEASPRGEAVSMRAYARGGDLVIDVTDRGPGIEPEKRRAVFTPFFTTKKEGTGLGLSIVKKIVEAHKGRIEILDNSGVGLTFRVELPGCLKGTVQTEKAEGGNGSIPKIRKRCFGEGIEKCEAA